MKQITKPKQAASARSLDRMQLQVKSALDWIANGNTGNATLVLQKLLKSMERSERR